jgi:hypothetical protein
MVMENPESMFASRLMEAPFGEEVWVNQLTTTELPALAERP